MDSRVKAVLAKLIVNPGASARLDGLASSVGLSNSHLRHLFKHDAGMPFGAFARRLRMERACALLESTFLSIKQITYEIGLSDERHFIREFKKAYGITPGAYRRGLESGGAAARNTCK